MIEALNNSLTELAFNENFSVDLEGLEIGDPASNAQTSSLPNGLQSLATFYGIFNGLNFEWELKSETSIHGSIKIQSIDLLNHGEWEDMVGEDHDGKEVNQADFRVFDFYSNQNYVGCFTSNYEQKGLFYVRENTVYPIGLTAEGYLQLLNHTLGFMHWPALLVKLNLGLTLNELQAVEENIAKVIPNFSHEKFETAFKSLSL